MSRAILGGYLLCVVLGFASGSGEPTAVQDAQVADLIKKLDSDDVQAKLGLRSNWFVLNNAPAAARPLQFFERNSNTAGPVDASFTFEQAPDAHRRLIHGRNTGKVVLTPR